MSRFAKCRWFPFFGCHCELAIQKDVASYFKQKTAIMIWYHFRLISNTALMKSLEPESTKSEFGVDGIPNTDQYLRLMQSQKLTKFGNMLCVVFPKRNLFGVVFIRFCVYSVLCFQNQYSGLIWPNSRNTVHFPLCFQTLSTQRLQILKLFAVVFLKY